MSEIKIRINHCLNLLSKFYLIFIMTPDCIFPAFFFIISGNLPAGSL